MNLVHGFVVMYIVTGMLAIEVHGVARLSSVIHAIPVTSLISHAVTMAADIGNVLKDLVVVGTGIRVVDMMADRVADMMVDREEDMMVVPEEDLVAIMVATADMAINL
jgi:hypothetical protein